MPFEKPPQEKPPAEKKEILPKEKQIEKLEKVLKKIAAELRAAGVPVDDDMRLNMDDFSHLYPNFLMNKLDAERIRKNIEDEEAIKSRGENPGLSRREPKNAAEQKKERMKRTGEQLEGAKTIIFHKFFKEYYVTTRTSLHDDYKNGVDNLIVDRKTGNLVGAFDEVADTGGKRFSEKLDTVWKKNFKEGGSMVKYALGLAEDGKIVPSKKEEHIPVLRLALSQAELDQALSDISADSEKTDGEKAVFKIFFDSMESQIGDFQKMRAQLNPKLMERVDSFAKKLAEIKDSVLE